MENTEVYQLSDQALGSLMMALQKSLLEESDIIPVLKGFQFINTNAGLEVTNPPVVRIPSKDLDDTEDN